MKAKYGLSNKESFDMDSFQSDQHEMLANLLIDRNADLLKAVGNSQKRDEERDARRRAAEEARRFE